MIASASIRLSPLSRIMLLLSVLLPLLHQHPTVTYARTLKNITETRRTTPLGNAIAAARSKAESLFEGNGVLAKDSVFLYRMGTYHKALSICWTSWLPYPCKVNEFIPKDLDWHELPENMLVGIDGEMPARVGPTRIGLNSGEIDLDYRLDVMAGLVDDWELKHEGTPNERVYVYEREVRGKRAIEGVLRRKAAEFFVLNHPGLVLKKRYEMFWGDAYIFYFHKEYEPALHWTFVITASEVVSVLPTEGVKPLGRVRKGSLFGQVVVSSEGDAGEDEPDVDDSSVLWLPEHQQAETPKLGKKGRLWECNGSLEIKSDVEWKVSTYRSKMDGTIWVVGTADGGMKSFNFAIPTIYCGGPLPHAKTY